MSSSLHEPHGDKKHKNPALPSLLSNLRNARSAFGRNTDTDLNQREIRPLIGGSGGGRPSPSPSSGRAPSTQFSLPSALGAVGARYKSAWRKRNRDAKCASGKTYRVNVHPQKFLAYFACVFVGLPIILLLYLVARHAVFGDEGVTTDGHKYEVHMPAPLGADTGEAIMTTEEASSLIDTTENVIDQTKIDGVADEIDFVSDKDDQVVDQTAELQLEKDGSKIEDNSTAQNGSGEASENQINIGQDIGEVLTQGADSTQPETNDENKQSLGKIETEAETSLVEEIPSSDNDASAKESEQIQKKLPRLPNYNEQSTESQNADATQNQISPVAPEAPSDKPSEVNEVPSQNAAIEGVKTADGDQDDGGDVVRQRRTINNPKRLLRGS